MERQTRVTEWQLAMIEEMRRQTEALEAIRESLGAVRTDECELVEIEKRELKAVEKS